MAWSVLRFVLELLINVKLQGCQKVVEMTFTNSRLVLNGVCLFVLFFSHKYNLIAASSENVVELVQEWKFQNSSERRRMGVKSWKVNGFASPSFPVYFSSSLRLKWKKTVKRDQFHQHSTSSFYARRSQKCNKAA